MIQAVFSGDNVLSALWEISVFWRNRLDLLGMPLLLSPYLFLSRLTFLKMSSALHFSFIPHFSLCLLPFARSLSLSHLSFSFFFFPELPRGDESKSPYLSFAHSPPLLDCLLSPLLPPSLPPLLPAFIPINARRITLSLIFLHSSPLSS